MRATQQFLLMSNASPLPTKFESQGVVYTKPWVVDLLLDLSGYRSENNLVDAIAIEPAAGTGAFVTHMIRRLLDSCKRLGRPLADCRDSLVAYELNELSAQQLRDLALTALLDRGADIELATELAHGWIRCGDYLVDSTSSNANFVIGNPPYVRLEEIPADTSQFYRDIYSTMRGRADLYIAFFEAALRQLEHDGVCAFICADRWMRNQYGTELRKFITADFSVEMIIEMHTADAFQQEVDAYPAITLIRRKRQGAAVVASAGPAVEKLSSQTLAAMLQGGSSHGTGNHSGDLQIAHVDDWFKGGHPWPCRAPRRLALLRRLEEQFHPLEVNAKIGIGVATGNDRVFITRDSHLVESSRLLKVALAKDISTGTLTWSGHYLVDPWTRDGLVDLMEYPRLRSYFIANELSLRERHTAIRNIHGWFKTIDRVTHSLAKKPKLYIADIKTSLDPVLDQGETYPHHNLYYVESDHWDLEVLGGLLMSAVGQFFVECYGIQMRGGYFRFQAQYLRRIRVPLPSNLSTAQARELKDAFRTRDKEHATAVALEIYRIDISEMETGFGY